MILINQGLHVTSFTILEETDPMMNLDILTSIMLSMQISNLEVRSNSKIHLYVILWKKWVFFVSEMEFGWESLQIHNVATKNVQSVFILYAEHHKKTEKHICSVNSVFLQIWFIYNSEFIQQSSYCSWKKKCIHTCILPKNISWFLKSFKIIRNHTALKSAW